MRQDYSIELETLPGGIQVIRVEEGKFRGVRYHYGRVWFENPDSDEPVLQFEYNIIEGSVDNKEEFGDFIAEILRGEILRGIENNSISYTGGVDDVKDLDDNSN